MSDTTPSNTSVVHDFRGMSSLDVYLRCGTIDVKATDILLYDDAEFVVEKAQINSCTIGGYENCGGCAFIPYDIERILSGMALTQIEKHEKSLSKWGLVKYTSLHYYTTSPCGDSPSCVNEDDCELIYKCTKSNVPWFVPSVETQNNNSQESEQPC